MRLSGIRPRLKRIFRTAKVKAQTLIQRFDGAEKTLFPSGHFYSPIACKTDLVANQEFIWRSRDNIAGIDYRSEKQLELLKSLQKHSPERAFPVDQPKGYQRYFYNNDQYPALDADFLYSALCEWRPKTMIEIGSGFSSLITAEVNRERFDHSLTFICVEPYPRQYLLDGVDGITELEISKVQDLPLSFFSRLRSGDILFIDSSHVSKVGSDVNFLFFDVLPSLAPGVYVHIHDIFLPDEYPKKWMIEEGRNWNEQYIVLAFLLFNSEWEIVWGSHYMGTRHKEAVSRVFSSFPNLGGGGSLWIRRKQTEVQIS